MGTSAHTVIQEKKQDLVIKAFAEFKKENDLMTD